jgi:hypothetical protein
MPPSAKRARQSMTAGQDVLSSLARALFALPEPAPGTICDRGAMRCSVVPGRASRLGRYLKGRVACPTPRGMTPATNIVKCYLRH